MYSPKALIIKADYIICGALGNMDIPYYPGSGHRNK
jgi:hypothetical protein